MNKYQQATQYVLGVLVLAYFSLLFTYIAQTPAPNTIPPKTNNQQKSYPTPDATIITVTRIIDGDTIQISTGETLRYIGVDTPEITGKDECYAQEATQKNTQLVLNKQVRLEKDKSHTDRYGRLLRYVYVDDVMINYELVVQGYAFSKTYPPDTKYQQLFEQAQQQAKAQKVGVWSDQCNYSNDQL